MTNSELFINAHSIARDTRDQFDSYASAFASALRGVWHVKKADLALVKVETKARPEKVTIEWSENRTISEFEGQTISFEEAEELLAKGLDEKQTYDRARGIADGEGGYDKTSVVVHFSNGDTYQFRLDLNANEKNITDAFQQRIAYNANRSFDEVPEFLHDNLKFWKDFGETYELAA